MPSCRRALTLGFLILWAISGPIGMAFDGCASMGMLCEGPCGLMPAIVSVVPDPAPELGLIGSVTPELAGRSIGVAFVFEPPPRPFSRSA